MFVITSPLLSTEEFNVLLRKLDLSEECAMTSTPLAPIDAENCQDFSNHLPGSPVASSEPATPKFEDAIRGCTLEGIMTPTEDLEQTPISKTRWDDNQGLVRQMNQFYNNLSNFLEKSDESLLQLTVEEKSALKSEVDLFYQYVRVVAPNDGKYRKLFVDIQMRLSDSKFEIY